MIGLFATQPLSFKEIGVKMTPRRDGRIKMTGAALVLLTALLAGCATTRMIRAGDQYAQESNWEEAHNIYAEALKADPFNRRLKQKVGETRSQAAKVHAQRAATLMAQGNIAVALEEAKQAMRFDPSQPDYPALIGALLKKKEALESLALGQKMIKSERYGDAVSALTRASELDPALPAVKEALDMAVARQAKQSASADSLSLQSRKPITLNFQNTKLKEVFGVLEKLADINIIFDKDVRDDPITIYAKDVTFIEALNLIFATNGLFMKKISDETILIAPKTKPKMDQYQDLLIRTFYLSHVKAKDMINLLRTMLETRRIYSNDELNTVVVRETPDKVALIEKIIDANDRKQAEVMVNVELLEVKRTKGHKYGLSLSPTQVSGSVGGAGDGISVQDLKGIDSSDIFVVLPSLLFDFFKQESEAQVLANPRVRVMDNKVAKIKVGDRVPILLSSTNTNAATTAGSTASTTTTTSIEFKDVGIDMTIEPSVHLEDDITMKVKLEVTSLGDLVDLGNNQRQFRFGNRSTETVLNIRDGETVVISGLLRDDDRESVVKVPGLGDIPVLGRLFSRTDKEKGKTDVVMSITPTLVRAREMPATSLLGFWSGTEDSYLGRPLFSDLSVIRPPDAIALPAADTPSVPAVPSAPAPPAAPASPSAPPAPPVLSVPKGARPILTFLPAESVVTAGSETTVAIRVDQVTALSSLTLTLEYDPTALTVKQVAEGSFLNTDGVKTRFVATTPPGGNTVDVQLNRVGDERGMTGAGTLFNLTLKAIHPGVAKLQIRSASLTDIEQEPIAADIAPAIIMVK